MNVLSRHLRNFRAVIPFGILKYLEKDAACGPSTICGLLVTDLVEDEEEVDEVAACAELFVAGVGIGMRAEELALTLREESAALLVGEDAIAVDPVSRLSAGTLPVRISGVRERGGQREKVREDELSDDSRHGGG